MIHAHTVRPLHGRFAHVMEQHGQTQDPVRTHIAQRLQGVSVYIKHMMLGMLSDTYHVIPLRQDHLSNAQFTGFADHLRIV